MKICVDGTCYMDNKSMLFESFFLKENVMEILKYACEDFIKKWTTWKRDIWTYRIGHLNLYIKTINLV